MSLPYDITLLKTPAECKTIMERTRGKDNAVYQAVFTRYCELSGQPHEDLTDPVIREFHEMLAAFEQIKSEINNRNTKATYTRRGLANKGVYKTLIDWALKPTETDGFKILVEQGLEKFTGEYIILKNSDKFSEDVINCSKDRFIKFGLKLP